MHYTKTASLTAIMALICCFQSSSFAGLLYDSFNGSNVGGFTSANLGGSSLVSVEQDVQLTNIGVLNSMFEAGEIIFHIWDPFSRVKLFETDPISLGIDDQGVYTWKMSPEFSYTLQAGRSYAIGSVSNVARLDALDEVSQTQNGISAGMVVYVTDGFPSTSTRIFNRGRDASLRLYGVPEPSACVLLFMALSMVHFPRRLGL